MYTRICVFNSYKPHCEKSRRIMDQALLNIIILLLLLVTVSKYKVKRQSVEKTNYD